VTSRAKRLIQDSDDIDLELAQSQLKDLARLVIVSERHPWASHSERLYWSNEYGWVDNLESADRFLPNELTSMPHEATGLLNPYTGELSWFQE